tara:strand:+ start:3931 stop:4140 length:210 start_codon:yes stop_codon:yes gene_type:complete
MYLKAYLIPTEKNTRDEWIINLHLNDNTKIEAKIVKGYKNCIKECKDWSEKLNDCPYEIGGVQYNGKEI